MIALAVMVRTLSVGDPVRTVLRIAGGRKMELSGMSKRFARRARLVREILRLATTAMRFVRVVLEILDKAANCDARKLPIQVQAAR
jgi:hypothetical protein